MRRAGEAMSFHAPDDAIAVHCRVLERHAAGHFSSA